jgi:hypothetical protein
MTVDNSVRVIYPLVAQPPDYNLSGAELKGTRTKVLDEGSQPSSHLADVCDVISSCQTRVSNGNPFSRESDKRWHDEMGFARCKHIYVRATYANTVGRSAVGNVIKRTIGSFQLGHYRSITACALVWMLSDICDHCRRIIDEAIRLKVRYAHCRSVPGRYRAISTAIASLHG